MPMMQLTDGLTTTGSSEAAEPSIVSSTSDHDVETAFSELVDEYSSIAYSVALRMLRKPEDAQDAVQDAFVSAYRAYSRFNGESKPSTWLYRIVVNACLMRLRKDKNQAKYLSDTDLRTP